MQADPEIVDEIYEAAAIPELWPDVLARLCQVASAWGSGLLVFDQQQRMRFTATRNYLDAFTSFAANGDAARYDNKRPKRAIAGGHVGFQHDLELFTQHELDTDPVYCDFIYPHGIRWTGGTVVPVPTSDVMVFDFSRRTEPFERADMERLDLYRPHLARAALLAHRLGLKAARAATDALDILGLPAAVLQRDRRVLAANGSLKALEPRVVIGAFDRIHLGAAPADTLFRAALADPALDTVRSIPLPATEASPAMVGHVVPIRRSAHDVFARGDVLLLLTLVTAPNAPLTEVLTGLFDLTPAEARIARGISTGRSLDELARAGGVSRETVRTQLKSLMMKTGTSRQVELAVLLSGISPR
jgi:DNA-binding CsgD family transcriptional regulator